MFESRKSDLKLFEISLMERIEEESNAKREFENEFAAILGNNINDLAMELNREAVDRKDAIGSLKNILEVFL